MNLITISKKICRLERSLKIYGTIHCSSDNLFVRTSEMTNVWKKVGNFIITHGHLDQSEEWICLYCWLRTHAMFDIACFHASFGALDIISNVLLILNIFSYSSGIKLSSETLYIYIYYVYCVWHWPSLLCATSPGLKADQIGGIATGSVFLVVVLIALCVYFFRWVTLLNNKAISFLRAYDLL